MLKPMNKVPFRRRAKEESELYLSLLSGRYRAAGERVDHNWQLEIEYLEKYSIHHPQLGLRYKGWNLETGTVFR